MTTEIMTRRAIDAALAAEGLSLTGEQRALLGRRIHMEQTEANDGDVKRDITHWVTMAKRTKDPVHVLNVVLESYPIPHDAAKIIQHLAAEIEKVRLG